LVDNLPSSVMKLLKLSCDRKYTIKDDPVLFPVQQSIDLYPSVLIDVTNRD